MAEETKAPDVNASTDAQDKSARLNELMSTAGAQYSLKNYTAAADLYSEACELQDEINGEMNPQNAELLFLYGRTLYKVAIAKSDVLGDKVAGDRTEGKPKSNHISAAATDAPETLPTNEQKLAEDIVEAAVESKDAPRTSEKSDKTVENQPYFQITGMENWDDDEEEEDEAEKGAEGDEQEEDEFVTAFEILDMTRVLLEKQLASLKSITEAESSGKGKEVAENGESMSAEERHAKERLADIHDLEAEIAMESERFLDAIPDARAALALKQELYPQHHNFIAEGHFKLSLVLEFAALTKIQQARAQEGEMAKISADDVDETMRAEAREQQELAIASCKLRLANEEAVLETLEGEDRKMKEEMIAVVKDIMEEMETRLADLRGPAVSLAFGPAGAPQLGGIEAEAGSGVFAQQLGETSQEQKKRIENAKMNAVDLTSLVRHKKPKSDGLENNAGQDGATVTSEQSNGVKRKADEHEDGSDKKRVKTHDRTG